MSLVCARVTSVLEEQTLREGAAAVLWDLVGEHFLSCSFPFLQVPAAARAGAIAPCDVTVPAQNTGLGPEKTSFFQALGITTKISRGTIEILVSEQRAAGGGAPPWVEGPGCGGWQSCKVLFVLKYCVSVWLLRLGNLEEDVWLGCTVQCGGI